MSSGFFERRAAEKPWRLADLVAGTLYWSPQLRVILGLPPNTRPPAPRGIVDQVHPEDAEAARQVFRRAFDPAGDGHALDEHRIVLPDGTVRWVQLRGQVQFTGEGLLDLGMPRLDGYGACRRMRQHPWGRRLTIVALTGWGLESDRRKTADAGFDAHWAKPVVPATIPDLLARVKAREG